MWNAAACIGNLWRGHLRQTKQSSLLHHGLWNGIIQRVKILPKKRPLMMNWKNSEADWNTNMLEKTTKQGRLLWRSKSCMVLVLKLPQQFQHWLQVMIHPMVQQTSKNLESGQIGVMTWWPIQVHLVDRCSNWIKSIWNKQSHNHIDLINLTWLLRGKTRHIERMDKVLASQRAWLLFRKGHHCDSDRPPQHQIAT